MDSDNQGQLPYDYTTAGFDKFFNRSVDEMPQQSLEMSGGTPMTTAIPFDRGQQSGSIGDTVRFGKVFIDGSKGRISVYDENGREITRIGELDD